MSEARYLLDASAVLALMFQEPGAGRIAEVLPLASIGSVNLSEVVAKLYDRRLEEGRVQRILAQFEITVIPFDRALAVRSGQLRQTTRHRGLSLGDRACLATAEAAGLTVVTADRAWSDLDLGIAVEVVR